VCVRLSLSLFTLVFTLPSPLFTYVNVVHVCTLLPPPPSDTGGAGETCLHKAVKAGRYKCVYMVLMRAAELGCLEGMMEGTEWGEFGRRVGEVAACRWDDVAGGKGDVALAVAVVEHFKQGGDVARLRWEDVEVNVVLKGKCEHDASEVWRRQFEMAMCGGSVEGGGSVEEEEIGGTGEAMGEVGGRGTKCDGCGEEGICFKMVEEKLLCGKCARQR